MTAAIQVDGLSKVYTLGAARRSDTFRDLVRDVATAPFRRLFGGGRREATTAEFWALRDVSFEVERGAVVGIVGRNGAGKSTLLKVLSRIVEPTRGEATLRGRVSSLLEVGTGFHPELTGRENIFLNGSILGMKRREITAKFDEIVAFAEVEKFLDTPVKRYSSGMYVRLAFAVAAHLEPEILIVDEVLAVGDLQFQKKCLGKMQDVVHQGRTVLFVSHQVSAVNQLCNRVLWLDQGRVVDYGRTRDVLPKYIEQGASHAPRITFEAPADGSPLWFRSVAIVNHEGKDASEIDASSPYTIELEGETSQELSGVELAVRVKTNEGVAVFTSLLSHHRDAGPRDLPVGRFRARIAVPGHYLMPGSYTVSAHAFRDQGSFEPLCLRDDVLRLQLLETGTRMAKYTNQKSIGVVLVDFPWELAENR